MSHPCLTLPAAQNIKTLCINKNLNMVSLARTRTTQEGAGTAQQIKTWLFNSRALSKDMFSHSLPGLLVNTSCTG